MSGQISTINELKSFLESHPHVQNLHIKADGSYHLNAYEGKDGKLYSRLDDYTKVGTEADLIVITIDRESVLNTADQKQSENKDQDPVNGSVNNDSDPNGGSAEPLNKLPEPPAEPVEPIVNGTGVNDLVKIPEETGEGQGSDS